MINQAVPGEYRFRTGFVVQTVLTLLQPDFRTVQGIQAIQNNG